MLKSRKWIFSIIAVVGIVCFSLGFVMAQSMEKTNWIGYLVHGARTHINMSIVPRPSGFAPKVDGDIMIGLRDDGVVVWKQVPDSTRR